VRLDECLRIINRRIRTAQDEVARRKRNGLQYRPWQHRVQELEAVRREIAALATPEALRAPNPPRQAGADGA
jgi:hypothetical protein